MSQAGGSADGASPGGRSRRGGTPAREALEGAMTAIAAAGCETPRLDAEILLCHVLAVPRERLLTDRDLTVSGPAVRALQEAVRRRALERESVAHITGRRAFRRLDLRVDHRALVPRPETELLVEVGLSLPAGARVLDLGTGTGAIALALADERPDLLLSGSDISEDALELARANAADLGLEVSWQRADLLEGLAGPFDAVLANLPYIAESERSALPPEVLRHDPAGALFAGADGLQAIARLAGQLGERPWPGLVALEVGRGQAAAVARLLQGAGFGDTRMERDLAGIERVVVGKRFVGEPVVGEPVMAEPAVGEREERGERGPSAA